MATGTFDPERHSERIKQYRASTELPGVIAVEAAKAETVEGLYGALGAKPPANVDKLKTLTAKPPSPQELCGADATSCKKFEGALEGFYGKLDRHDLEADTAKEANAIVIRQRQHAGPRPPARPR